MQIKSVFLQTAVTVPGKINTETTLSVGEKVKCSQLLGMEWKPEGLMLYLTGDERALVPHANVKVAILEKIQEKRTGKVSKEVNPQVGH